MDPTSSEIAALTNNFISISSLKSLFSILPTLLLTVAECRTPEGV